MVVICMIMIADHAVVLRRVYSDVSSKLDAQSVARLMFQSNALTLKELESIQSRRSEPVSAAEQLLNIVMNQSQVVYRVFIDDLKLSGQQHVVEMISNDRYQCKMRGTRSALAYS